MFQLTGCVSQLVVATVLVLDSNNICTWQGEERRGEERRGEERRREAEEKAMIGEGPHLLVSEEAYCCGLFKDFHHTVL